MLSSQFKNLFRSSGGLRTSLLASIQLQTFNFCNKPNPGKQHSNSSGTKKVLARHAARAERTYFEKSGWLPNKQGLLSYQEKLVKKCRRRRELLEEEGRTVEYVKPVKDLQALIESDSTVNHLVNSMLSENETLLVSPSVDPEQAPGMGITTLTDLLDTINDIIQGPPEFDSETELVGVPLAALFTGLDATLSGQALFLLPSWNQQLTNILGYWNEYLNDESKDSNKGFTVRGKQWLSPKATENWTPDLYVKDNKTLPWYNTWNSFFTRDFADKDINRPIGGSKTSNRIITAPQDGAFYCIDTGVIESDAFWFKDMPYSLDDIFNYGASDDQRKIFRHHNLIEKFTNGHIFQCFLGPYNFHRWWTPVCGDILFDPTVVPGFYYSKNKIPDIAGSTTDSVRYLLHCNARGIVVIDTSKTDTNIGLVCCVPIGMCEVSTVRVNQGLKKGVSVNKGDEIGAFEFGGSTFAILFEDLSKYNKKITWKTDRLIDIDGTQTDEFPVDQEVNTPSVTGTGNILCGMQIAIVDDI